jgi:hypothetical protein
VLLLAFVALLVTVHLVRKSAQEKTASRAAEVLQGYVAARGYVLAGYGFEALVNGVRVAVTATARTDTRGPSVTYTARGTARRALRVWLSLDPKHAATPGGLRVGDVDFDEGFLVQGSSLGLALEVLDDEARRALLAFGPRGLYRYEDGAFVLDWETWDGASFEELDRALLAVAAVCAAGERGYRE